MKRLRLRPAMASLLVLAVVLAGVIAIRAVSMEPASDAAIPMSSTASDDASTVADGATTAPPQVEDPSNPAPGPAAPPADRRIGPGSDALSALPDARASVPGKRVARGAARPKRKAAVADTASFEGDRLPVDSPYDLPPIVELRLPRGQEAATADLRAYVLRLRSLALAPAARESVKAGQTSSRALELVARLSRAEAPLLVHRARGGRLRVQATSLEGTRSIVRAARTVRGVSVALRPVRRDFADVAQTAADARTSEIGARVVALALEQVGVPYSWGGGNATGPSTGTCAGYTGSIQPCPATRTVGFDCSGLTLYAYAQVGIALDHYAAFQWLEGRRIASTELMPGDLVFFSPKADGPGHMGMYVGSGRFVHAPRTGDVVKISNLSEYARSYMGAVRPY